MVGNSNFVVSFMNINRGCKGAEPPWGFKGAEPPWGFKGAEPPFAPAY